MVHMHSHIGFVKNARASLVGPRGGKAAGAPVSGPFRSLEGSKHAYYLVFDFEMAVTDKFGSTCYNASQ